MKSSYLSFMVTVAVLSILILFAPHSGAQLYRWVDQNGVTHFTDNPQNIPEQFKSNVEEFTPPQITTYAEEKRKEGSALTPSWDDTGGEFRDSEGAIEELEESISTLKSQIKAKKDLVDYVDDRRNLAKNPLRNRIITENELELYDRYVSELPDDERELEELEDTLRTMEESGAR